MNERIKAHIEGLFQSAPRTKKIIELKEEIMSNCNCKYEDLIAGGATSDEAFKTVIAGIGDVSELISQLETGVSPDAHLVEEFREWKVQKDQKNSLRSNISAILWPSILIAYFLISFLTQAWYITWVLFIAGVMIEGIISVIFDLRKDK